MNCSGYFLFSNLFCYYRCGIIFIFFLSLSFFFSPLFFSLFVVLVFVFLVLVWFAFYAVSIHDNELFLPDIHGEDRHEHKSRSKRAQKVQQSEGIKHAAD